MPDHAVPAGSERIPAAPHGTTVESLLKPNANQPDDGYVHLGNLRVEKAIFDDFKKAQEYLGKSSEARDQLYALEHGRTEIDVRSTSVGHDESGSRDGRPTISWAPRGALLNTDGSQQSPAMGLLHEEGHSTEWLAHPERYNNDSAAYPVGTADRERWTTPEERRNIEGLEHRVAKELGEGTRDDHHGEPYTSRGPTSIRSEAVHRVSERIAQLKAEGKDVPPVSSGVHGVVQNDYKPHTGSFVDIGNGEVAQSIGQGKYMLYEVKTDLGGHMPPEADRTTSNNPQQNFNQTPVHEQAHTR